MTNEKLQYLESEFLTVAPLPVEMCGQFKLKITSNSGQTKWLNITPQEFRSIEDILLGIKFPQTKLID